MRSKKPHNLTKEEIVEDVKEAPVEEKKAEVVEEDETTKARGDGQGNGGGRQGDGGASTCKCPECGTTAKHEKGTLYPHKRKQQV